MTRVRKGPIAVFLAASLLAASPPMLSGADGTRTAGPDADAARLVEEGAAQGGRQRRGTRSARGPARSSTARSNAPAMSARQTVPGSSGRPATPLAAERHAGSLAGNAAGRGGSAEILIFTSLSVPAASWRQWAREAARSAAPLVLRGVGAGGLPETAKRIGERLGGAGAGVAIDPRLFPPVRRRPRADGGRRAGAACRRAGAAAARRTGRRPTTW